MDLTASPMTTGRCSPRSKQACRRPTWRSAIWSRRSRRTTRTCRDFRCSTSPEISLSRWPQAGYDGCSTASNHSLDRGVDGNRSDARRAGTSRPRPRRHGPHGRRSRRAHPLRRSKASLSGICRTPTVSTNFDLPPDQQWAVDVIDPDAIEAEGPSRGRCRGGQIRGPEPAMGCRVRRTTDRPATHAGRATAGERAHRSHRRVPCPRPWANRACRRQVRHLRAREFPDEPVSAVVPVVPGIHY